MAGTLERASAFESRTIGDDPAIASLNPADWKRTRSRSPGLRRRLRAHDRSQRRCLRALAHVPRPETRPNRSRNRRRIAPLERRPRHPGHARNGQDPGGRQRRSAGDDRHRRFRRRPFAATLRAHHRERAARAPHVRTMAPARRGRRDLGVQFPGCRVVVERAARGGVRRLRHLEAVPQNAADRHRRAKHLRPRSRAARLERRVPTDHRRRRHHRQAIDRGPPHSLDQRDRLDTHGAHCRGDRRSQARPHAARTGRQ